MVDGVVGDVLFWTVRRVVGDDHYTVELHNAWVKVYSRMLKVLVPAGVALELKGGSGEVSLSKRDLTSMFIKGSSPKTGVTAGHSTSTTLRGSVYEVTEEEIAA